MPEQWLNYTQLAGHWHMSPEAARTRARRGRFQRRTGNGGQTEVLIDTDAPAPRVRPPRSGGQSRANLPPPTPATETPPTATTMALEALQGHIDTLKAELAKAEALAAERGQEVADERAKVADITSQLLKITTELLEARKAEARPRSWWQRLTG
jgi:hypothetical protein